jgi:hypothetical protein
MAAAWQNIVSSQGHDKQWSFGCRHNLDCLFWCNNDEPKIIVKRLFRGDEHAVTVLDRLDTYSVVSLRDFLSIVQVLNSLKAVKIFICLHRDLPFDITKFRDRVRAKLRF